MLEEIFEETRENILHVVGWGFNGIVGQSVIGIARDAVGMGIAGDQFAGKF